MAAFEELGVMPEIIRAVEEMGWLLPTPVQAEAVPLILGGGDVAAAAETGSGKTGAFALPILQVVHEALREEASSGGASGSKGGAAPQADQQLVLNVEDRDPQMAISGDGLSAQSRSEKSWQGCRGSFGVRTGKHYYEATVMDEGLCRVGWSSASASRDLGTDKMGYGFGGTGKKSNNKQFDSYGAEYGKGDVIGCWIDCEEKQIGFYKNGEDLDVAFDLPPQAAQFGLYPAICLKNAEVKVNFGSEPMRFGPPEGFKPVGQATAQQAVGKAAAAPGGKGGAGGQRRGPLALIMEPARELAEQVEQEIAKFKKYLTAPTVRSALFVGGADIRDQMRALGEGLDVVTGTTGRIQDLVNGGKLDVSSVRFFVLDEADRLLDTGNQATIMEVFGRLAKNARVQTLLFSATLHSPEIRALSEKIQRFPTWVDLKGRDFVPETVHHAVVRIDPRADTSWRGGLQGYSPDGIHDKDNVRDGSDLALSQGVKYLKAAALVRLIDALKIDSALVFVRTKLDADNLEAFLVARGGGRRYNGKAEKGLENPYSCVVLHGDRPGPERKRNYEAFKEGDVRFLICTDVAARGLDVAGLPFVVNMTLPDKSEDYIHRIGRTGRADHMGMAISLVATVKEKVWYHSCPSKGRNCGNFRLAEQGGCAMWYDEPALLREVEKRVGHPIVELDANFRMPGQAEAGPDAVKYGQKRADPMDAVSKDHLEKRRPAIRRLATLETKAQQSFWGLKHRYGAKRR